MTDLLTRLRAPLSMSMFAKPIDLAAETLVQRHEAAEEIERLRGALAVIASGKVPADKHGHYLAHRSAVRLARRTLGQGGSEVGDELAREGPVSGMNPLIPSPPGHHHDL